MSQVIAFAGRIGSGKSSVSSALAARLGVPRAGFGDYVRKVAAYLGLDPTERVILQDLGEFLARYPEALCRRVLEEAAYDGSSSLIMDGVRHEEILAELRRQVAPTKVILVYVEAADDLLQLRRTEVRGERGDFQALEQHSTEVQVPERLLQLADIRFQSDDHSTVGGSAEELIKVLRVSACGHHLDLEA